jgi:hypothetical protein
MCILFLMKFQVTCHVAKEGHQHFIIKILTHYDYSYKKVMVLRKNDHIDTFEKK